MNHYDRADVLVVGGGPAGIAAAVRAAECGAKVLLVDDNPALGGQIWRKQANKSVANQARAWLQKLHASNVGVLQSIHVFDHPRPGQILAESDAGLHVLQYSKLVLATGARERFLPFPGWTLPNVLGVGGLQALVKSGLPIRGKRVVVAGTGPLLFAVADFLMTEGAEIAIIAEQAAWASLAKFGAHLMRQPAKLVQALGIKLRLPQVLFSANCWPVSAHGTGKLETVTLFRGGKTLSIGCDYLACGFHLIPNTELAALIGCNMELGFVRVNCLQETSVPSVFCAGEPTGIGGLECSLIEGEIAGFAAAGKRSTAEELLHQRAKLKQFENALKRTFELRKELKTLPTEETILCRCEDVAYGRLLEQRSWRSAKLETRCGMGPCQGRVCGPAAEFLLRWGPDYVRPPIFPTRFDVLASPTHSQEKHEQGGHA